MCAAAQDVRAGGPVAELFGDAPVAPRSVPALRLLAALHHLVLSGRAPRLAAFYPSTGGRRPLDGVWPVALDTLSEHAAWVRERLGRVVQTNDPGRAAVLYPALLWLVERYALPIRLLEIGASAGLNLLADRFCYVSGGRAIGAAASPVRLVEPWRPPPPLDLERAAARLRIVDRAGCDPAPLDSRDREDRLTVLSYVWPDELERLDRARAALELAALDPPAVARQPAQEWLGPVLAEGPDAQLTVVWQSVVRQYVEPRAWEAIELALRRALDARHGGHRPLVWLRMEPGEDHVEGFRLTIASRVDERERLLARCGDHGPPVAWKDDAETP
jgi:hypothetical protein